MLVSLQRHSVTAIFNCKTEQLVPRGARPLPPERRSIGACKPSGSPRWGPDFDRRGTTCGGNARGECAASRSRSGDRETGNREMAMPHRLHPPRVDAGEKVRMGDKMRVERSLVDDLATRDVNQDRVLLHQAQFAGADQSLGGGRQCGAETDILGAAVVDRLSSSCCRVGDDLTREPDASGNAHGPRTRTDVVAGHHLRYQPDRLFTGQTL
jgi:hypothetical protein